MAARAAASAPPKTFDEHVARIQELIASRKMAEPAFKSLMEENAGRIDALYRSIHDVFAKIKTNPDRLAFAKKFFQCSYAAAVVVPNEDDFKELFTCDSEVLAAKEPLSDDKFDEVAGVICKRMKFFIDEFFAKQKTPVVQGFLKAIGPSAEHVLYQFSQCADVEGKQKCYYLLEYKPHKT